MAKLTLDRFTNTRLRFDNPIAINFDVEFKNLTLMCGANGVGKTFLNKMTWATMFIANAFLLQKEHNAPVLSDKFTDIDLVQFVLDTTFSDQDFNGDVKFYNIEPILGTPEEFIDFTIVDGKVTDLEYDFQELESASNPVYLSAQTRQFSAIESYTSIKDLMRISHLTCFEDIEKLTGHFPLYDIFAMELLIGKFPAISEVLKQLAGASPDLSDELPNITEMFVEKGKVYGTIDGNKTRISNLGAGHQALLIMFIGAI